MRNRIATLTVFLIVTVAISSGAFAQSGQSKAAKAPKAAAPVRDLNGVWAGPVQATLNAVPPMTPWGEQQFSANKALGGISTAKIDIVDAGVSTDPAQQCDPAGIPLAVDWQVAGNAVHPGPHENGAALISTSGLGARFGPTAGRFRRMPAAMRLTRQILVITVIRWDIGTEITLSW